MTRKAAIIISILAAFFPVFPAHAAKGKRKGWRIHPGKIKNIIFMISDGWGYNQIDATNFFQHGKANAHIYEHFPVKLGMSTYMVPGSYDPDAAWAYFNYFTYVAADSAAAVQQRLVI